MTLVRPPARSPRRDGHPARAPYYPWLIALYGPLALAVANVDDGITPGEVALPLLVSVAFALVGWITGRLLTPDPHRRALIAVVVVGLLAFGGLPIQAAAAATPLSTLPRWIAVAELALLCGVIAFALRTRWTLRGVSRFMNATSAVLLLFVLLGASRAALGRRDLAPAAALTLGEIGTTAAADALPDIYYIVLDSYSNGVELREQYGLDHRGFETALQQRGFVVPQHARANYIATFLSLTAALNWNYLDDVARDLGPASRDRRVLHGMIEDSRTWRFLKQRGYRMVFVPSRWAGTSRSRDADLVITQRGTTEFQAVWFEGTVLRLLGLLCGTAPCVFNRLYMESDGADVIRWRLDEMARLPRTNDPRFVFAHLTVPHEPFVFRRDCSSRAPYRPTSDEDARWRAAYGEQVECVGRLLLALVDRIKLGASRETIIVLQGDHGHGRFPGARAPTLSAVSRDQVDDRTHVFAAYYMPRVPARAISDSITAVNVWPLLLTHYFATPTPLLPDRTYWSTARRPYEFTRVR